MNKLATWTPNPPPSTPANAPLISQVSREGFQSIDEYLENHRNVDRHEWVTQPHLKNMEDYELMTNRVEWAYPTQTREFVALDVVDRKRKILISKSALHPDRPGGSRYQTVTDLDETEYVRAVQYYASKVEPLPDGKCLLRMVTWGEMCDSYTAFWVNKFNAHVFITPKFQRFRCVHPFFVFFSRWREGGRGARREVVLSNVGLCVLFIIPRCRDENEMSPYMLFMVDRRLRPLSSAVR